jgi:hypothetical protein
MKCQWFFFFVLVSWSGSVFARKVDGTKQEFVEFDGNRLPFAYEGQVPGTKFRQYVPAGEGLKNWTKMARIEHYSNVNDPRVLAKDLARLTRKMNPDAPLEARYNNEKRIAMVDFITWPPNSAYVEFNVFRIEQEGKDGLVSYNYAVREYQDPSSISPSLDRSEKGSCKRWLTRALRYGKNRRKLS